MGPRREPLRLVRLTGVLTWLLVATPPVVEGIDGPPAAFRTWLVSMLVFAALFAWTTGRLGRPVPALRAALAGQSACVIVMSAAQYHGLEGTLLVLVSLQLGLVAPRRVGLPWIAVQSLAMAWAIQHHWALRPALMFAPPYVGFQVLTFLMVQLLAREGAARESLSRANAELTATRERLADSARVGERLRIARELHDAMGHHLAGLSLNLEALGQRQGQSPPLETARSLTRRLLDDLESLVDTLGRERDLDLASALASLARDIPRPRVHVTAGDLAIPDPQHAHALWRCCQEIVTNAVKHSEAENVWIAIRVNDAEVELTARDDGNGCAHPAQGQGLEGMRQRLHELGGVLHLEPGQGTGFQVRVTLPRASA
jgi:signal transduction histidine kinase